ncbi:LysR family transcriptional regulator, partial [Acinetobacter baumannii]
QRLQQLEKKLGARLVDRTARSLRFTQEGALLCERGAELIRQLDALSEDLQTRQGGLVGTLKVNAPLGFGRRYIAPVIRDFQQEHPDVDIEL